MSNSRDEALSDLAALIAGEVASRLRDAAIGEIVDQDSPEARALGPRRYIAAIRCGELPGSRIGRRWVSLRADVRAYIRRSDVVETEPKSRLDVPDTLLESLGVTPRNGVRP